MAGLLAFVDALFPDVIIYALILIFFVVGIFKCCMPVYRSASALRHAAGMLRDGAKAKMGRLVWNDPAFLGKRLQPLWQTFLQSADMGAASGVSADVADYVYDEPIIDDMGKASLANIIPGLCTSLGILGTFIGLIQGLMGLDMMNPESIVQLTSGLSFAFFTSIVGIIASILFNIIYHNGTGRAESAIDSFVTAFYQHGIPQPPSSETQLLTYEREQADALGQFAQDMSVHLAGEIHHAIATAMAPVQQTMDDFINAATRAQVDGLDYIVARFIDRMNNSLDGQLQKLRTALSETAEGQLASQAQLRGAVESIGELTRQVVDVHGVSEQVIGKFAGFVGDMGAAYRQVSDTQADVGDLLEEISEASIRQSKYLSALQEYQAKLQGSFQEYTVWTDRFVGGLEERTVTQNASLEQINMEMRASAELLSGAYKSFTESVELGLANALGLFDENMQTLMKQVGGTLTEIQATMTQLEDTIRRATTALPDDSTLTPDGQEVT